ncbi:MAG: DUF2746 domain-containing protein [Microbacterium ginsengisoli]|jgi:hypothetical protein|uniref:DUF2746 domain-containing protein n=1 Tax=Microbacterium TaxID=33882 RepID=UPI0006F9E7A8|nr:MULTISPECIES: DUF2746 domain-containing protein [unclassified Microbacterium]KQR97703.1 hypothetical protein ASF93_13320 [Microbacterium sp. Leaf347]KQS01727.1 hypothetical protein ASG00_09845 [Microbacterium sp. Leaf351]MBN9198530.1 DUF2746 domain-containing protein [Microbacterium ginsengisoli]OJU78086.1 MAG: hypothetical protein BGO15_02480 [Microbacterium sp. 71-23]
MTAAPRTRMNRAWWVFSAAGVLTFVISGLILLGGTPAPDGQSWLRDPDSIILQILVVVGAVTSVAAPAAGKLQRIGTGVEKTVDHVVNSHGGTILRDDIDELKDLVRAVRSEQKQQRQDILGIREEIGQIRKSERDQWNAIETTANRNRKET